MEKLQEKNQILKERKDLKIWEERLIKESNKLKFGEDELKLKEKEIKINKPSRSAKLRYAFKISDDKNFEEEILKTFKYLIDIENFSVKL